MAYININSGESEVLVGVPVVLLLVALVENVAHGLLFLDVVVVLEHAHLIELHLPEERFFFARVP